MIMNRWSKFICVTAIALAMSAIRGGAEIKCPPDAVTENQFYQEAMKVYLTTSVDVYKASAAATQPAMDNDVVGFMTRAQRNMLDRPGAPSLEALVKEGRKLDQRGCKDPLVLYFLGMALKRTNHNKEAEPFLCQAADSMASAHYPANWQARAAEDAFTVLKANGKKNRFPAYRDKLIAAVADIFKDHVFAGNRGLLVRNLYVLLDDLPSPLLQKILTAAKAVPDADPAALLYIEGEWQIQAAWQDRGDDWASKVTAKGWQGFADHLAKARIALVQAWDLDPKITETATAMIHVSMGESNPEEMRTWFDRAVAMRFDDADAYDSYIYGIYPRWLGNREALMGFADECAATERYDTQVPLKYFLILLVVRTECDGGKMDALVLPNIYDKAHGILEKTLGPGGALPNNRQYRSAEAAYAVLAHQWPDASHAIEALNGRKLDAETTKDMGLTPDQIEAALKQHPGDGN
jgi:Domain of unknown function (DUF4034)